MSDSKFILNMDIDSFLKTIALMYDELLVYDNKYNIIYINNACARHYSCTPEEMIGKTFWDFIDDKWWEPSVLPMVYEQKKAFAIRQKTYIGKELLTIATPIFDDNNEIAYVVMNVRDEVNEKDILNPQYISKNHALKAQERLIYKSKEMVQVIDMLAKISQASINTVFTGESGTGKTILANYLHSISDRMDKPFVSINCATIPSNLIESELFGYVKGAFTGADPQGKKGLFEIADQGILFLDEVTELSSSAQAKLLHVMQSGEFIPIGGTKTQKVNVRILAATNKVLKDLVALGSFREDLYYRLNVVEVHIAPLRLRKDDILPLIYHFLNEFNVKYSLNRSFTDEALKVLTSYKWPGNTRELKHIVERLVVTSDTIVIDVSMLPRNLFNISEEYNNYFTPSFEDYNQAMEEYERKLVQKAYENHNSSRKLADYFSVSQTKANRLIAKHIKRG